MSVVVVTHIHIHLDGGEIDEGDVDDSAVLAAIAELRTLLMTQLSDLRDAIGAVGSNLSTLGTDIGALAVRIDALGGPDLDTSAEAAELNRIASVLAGTSGLVNSMAGGATVPVEDVPVVDPAPVDPDPEVPIEPAPPVEFPPVETPVDPNPIDPAPVDPSVPPDAV